MARTNLFHLDSVIGGRNATPIDLEEVICNYPIPMDKDILRAAVVTHKLVNKGNSPYVYRTTVKFTRECKLLDLDELRLECPACKTGRHLSSYNCQIKYIGKQIEPQEFASFGNRCTMNAIQQEMSLLLIGQSKRTKLHKVLHDQDVLDYIDEVLKKNDHKRLCKLYAESIYGYGMLEFHGEPIAYVKRAPSIFRGSYWAAGPKLWLVLVYSVINNNFRVDLVLR